MLRRGVCEVDRTAINTIKGYFYQFDYYILKILESNDGEEIVVEGIEDVDIKTATETTAIQCKYYAKTDYNHSVIKKPIHLMLEDFKKNRDKNTKYTIYGHYNTGQEKLPEDFDIDFFKEHFLKYTKKIRDVKTEFDKQSELGLSDEDIELFLSNLSIDINALEFETQNKKIIEEITKHKKCKRVVEAEYYYNNALNLVRLKSIEDKVEDRSITKKLFLSEIDSKKILFDEWYKTLRGREEFFRTVRNELFGKTVTLPNFARFFLLDCTSVDIVELKDILIHIGMKMSKTTERHGQETFCPYIYLNGLDYETETELKQQLFNDDIRFVDGYNFRNANFDINSLLVTPNSYNGIKIKLIDEQENINLIMENIRKVKTLYQFYLKDVFYENTSCKHYKIPIEEISDIKKIIL